MLVVCETTISEAGTNDGGGAAPSLNTRMRRDFDSQLNPEMLQDFGTNPTLCTSNFCRYFSKLLQPL